MTKLEGRRCSSPTKCRPAFNNAPVAPLFGGYLRDVTEAETVIEAWQVTNVEEGVTERRGEWGGEEKGHWGAAFYGSGALYSGRLCLFLQHYPCHYAPPRGRHRPCAPMPKRLSSWGSAVIWWKWPTDKEINSIIVLWRQPARRRRDTNHRVNANCSNNKT